MDYFSGDTIVAVATSLAGDGGVGIIRLSGPKSMAISQKFTRGFEKPNPRFLHRIEVIKNQEVIDDGLAVYFAKEASFTGEEVVELQIHGGRFLLQEILKLLISSGECRMALPGEFSFRSVKNNKMSLNQAQAIAQLVKAKSQYETWSARQNISGNRMEEFSHIASELKEILAKVELSIDFSDQDVEVISQSEAITKIKKLISDMGEIKTRLELSQRIAKGPLVVFYGKPNAGKSSLFNQLLSEDRSIVSAEAGTTRDIVTEDLRIGPYTVRVADTAGLRSAKNSIEKTGIEKAEKILTEGDLLVLVADATDFSIEANRELINQTQVLVLNKKDIIDAPSLFALVSSIQKIKPEILITQVSAKTGDGVLNLIQTIQKALDSKFGLGLSTPLPTEFQLQMFERSILDLQEAQNLIAQSGLAQPEVLSAVLFSAVNALKAVVGETTADSILNKIFSEFCIGK